jgi:hypothetical protein
VQLLRLGGDQTRAYNGAEKLDAPPDSETLLARRDVTDGMRCAAGADEHNVSACSRAAPPAASTRWGVANLSRGFAWGARYYVCTGTLSATELVRRARAGDSTGYR